MIHHTSVSLLPLALFTGHTVRRGGGGGGESGNEFILQHILAVPDCMRALHVQNGVWRIFLYYTPTTMRSVLTSETRVSSKVYQLPVLEFLQQAVSACCMDKGVKPKKIVSKWGKYIISYLEKSFSLYECM